MNFSPHWAQHSTSQTGEKPQRMDAQQTVWHMEGVSAVRTTNISWMALILDPNDGCGTTERSHLESNQEHTCWTMVEDDQPWVTRGNTQRPTSESTTCAGQQAGRKHGQTSSYGLVH